MKRWSWLYSAVLMLLVVFSITRVGQTQTIFEKQVTTNTIDQSECAIAVNPLNSNHLMAVWNDFKDAGGDAQKAKAGYAFSTDGGSTWSIINVIPEHSVDDINYLWGFDPSCSIDRSGNAYYCYVARPTDPSSQTLGPVHLSQTSTNGSFWNHVRVSPGLTSQDKPFMAVDNTGGTYNGRIYVAWTDFANNQNHIKFAVSINGGTAFPTVISLANLSQSQGSSVYLEPGSATDEDPSGPFLQGPVPAVAPNGDVYVAWLESDGPAGSVGQIKVRRGISSGSTPYISFPASPKSFDITVAWKVRKGWYRISSMPTLAVDQNTGYVYVAWTQLGTGNDLNVYYSRSTDSGQNWSTPAVATDPAFNSKAQFFPWLSVAPTGRVGLVFCDDRNDPSPTDGIPLIDVYFTESLNNGSSFTTPNTRITSVSSDGTNGAVTLDYQGMASTAGPFLPVWNDFRNASSQNVDVYFGRVNRSPASNVSAATAGNGQRKLVRDSNGTYHLVYETNQEIWYARKTTTDPEWNNYQHLSNGLVGGNSSPSIALRGSAVFVAWQRQNGSTHDVYFHRSTDSGATWPTGNRIPWAGVGSPQPLPVVASPATNEVMVVYRSGGNLVSKRSTNNGSGFTTTNTITGSALNSPSVAPAKNPSGGATTALAYATAEIPNASSILAQYYIPSNWSGTFTLTNNLPGNLSQHAHPSIAFSGSGSNTAHVAWDAYSSEVDVQSRVILHRVMSSWVVPSTYFKFELGFHEDNDRPSVTGLANNKAAMAFQTVASNILTGTYNGTAWTISLTPIAGRNPSFSIGQTTAKYATTTGSSTPFQVSLSSSTFSKIGGSEDDGGWQYVRAAGLVDTTSGAWLNVRLESFMVKHQDGRLSRIDFSPAPPDTVVLSPEEAWAALCSADFTLPVDADSLITVFSVSGKNVASLSDGSAPLELNLRSEAADASLEFPRLPLTDDASLNSGKLRFGASAKGLRSGSSLSFKTSIRNQKSSSSIVANLGHIYKLNKSSENLPPKLTSEATTSLPEHFVLEQNYPNPFNPETIIKYQLASPAVVSLKIYNLRGQEVRTLVDAFQNSGNHEIRWDGRDDFGNAVASGVYLYRLQAGEHAAVKKLTLLR